MTDSITIRIPGKPRGKGRPRFKHIGSVYTDPKTRAYEEELALLARLEMRKRLDPKPIEGPVSVSIKAVFQIPRSWPKKTQKAAREGWMRPTIVPDSDNILKLMDGFNSIIWKDDKQVVSAAISKFYGSEPYVEFIIRPLDVKAAA